MPDIHITGGTLTVGGLLIGPIWALLVWYIRRESARADRLEQLLWESLRTTTSAVDTTKQAMRR